MDKNDLVCFFDSGIGGLNLLYECVRRLPNIDFTYFADNYNVPYGNLEKNELINRVDGIFNEINKLNPSAAVLGCNTVTAQCIDFLRAKYPFEIIGIQPAIKPAALNEGKCIVLATPSTAESTALKQLVQKFGNGRTHVVALTNLASYIEKNAHNIDDKEVIKMLPDVKADSVVLGCTHYIYVKNIISGFYKCPIYDGISGTAAHLCEKLGISDHQTMRAQKITFSGGDCDKNRNIFRAFLKQSGIHSQKI